MYLGICALDLEEVPPTLRTTLGLDTPQNRRQLPQPIGASR